jgi:hypothetical protein
MMGQRIPVVSSLFRLSLTRNLQLLPVAAGRRSGGSLGQGKCQRYEQGP